MGVELALGALGGLVMGASDGVDDDEDEAGGAFAIVATLLGKTVDFFSVFSSAAISSSSES